MSKEKSETVQVIESNCVGCYKCIGVCPATQANVAYIKSGENKVKIDEKKCISCGACISICDHEGRRFQDNTDTLFEQLKKGKKISIIAAPSIRYNFKNYKKVLGYLKNLGVNNIYDVSFGADITTWAYLKIAKEFNLDSIIAQPCPAIVNYIERYKPCLIEKLAPIQSPAVCTAIYMSKYKNITDSIALLSPCVSKFCEFKDKNTKEYVKYNVTFKRLLEYFNENNIDLNRYQEAEYDDIECGLGFTFSKPGGLAENVRLHNPDLFIRQVEGTDAAYNYLDKLESRIKNNDTLPFLIDILNCSHGCNIGTGTTLDKHIDDIDNQINILKKEKATNLKKFDILKMKSTYKLFEDFDKRLNLKDFQRLYEDKSHLISISEPSEDDYEKIFLSLHKHDKISRNINCFSCGYGYCKEFAKAVHNGVSNIKNCAYYCRKEIEIENKQIEDINKELQQAHEYKNKFLSSMSHELRTPLNAILGFSELLRNKFFGDLNKKQEEYVSIIESSGKHLLTLINDILDLAKIEANTISFNPELCNLQQMLNEINQTMEPLFSKKNIDYTIEINTPVTKIDCDEGKFKQIFFNLLSNSLKFTPNNGKVHIIIENDGIYYLKFSVIDNGIGINKDVIDRIFEEFYQSHKKRDQALQGTGLGLYLTKNLIDLHNGEIGCESEPKKGSIFWFTLPIKSNQSLF